MINAIDCLRKIKSAATEVNRTKNANSDSRQTNCNSHNFSVRYIQVEVAFLTSLPICNEKGDSYPVKYECFMLFSWFGIFSIPRFARKIKGLGIFYLLFAKEQNPQAKRRTRGELLLHFAKQTAQAVKGELRKMLRSPFQNAPPERFSTAFNSPRWGIPWVK